MAVLDRLLADEAILGIVPKVGLGLTREAVVCTVNRLAGNDVSLAALGSEPQSG